MWCPSLQQLLPSASRCALPCQHLGFAAVSLACTGYSRLVIWAYKADVMTRVVSAWSAVRAHWPRRPEVIRPAKSDINEQNLTSYQWQVLTPSQRQGLLLHACQTVQVGHMQTLSCTILL